MKSTLKATRVTASYTVVNQKLTRPNVERSTTFEAERAILEGLVELKVRETVVAVRIRGVRQEVVDEVCRKDAAELHAAARDLGKSERCGKDQQKDKRSPPHRVLPCVI